MNNWDISLPIRSPKTVKRESVSSSLLSVNRIFVFSPLDCMWEGDINYKWKCSKWGRSSLPFPIYYLLSSSQYPFSTHTWLDDSASYLSLYLGFGFFENLSTGQMRVKQVPLCNDFLRFAFLLLSTFLVSVSYFRAFVPCLKYRFSGCWRNWRINLLKTHRRSSPQRFGRWVTKFLFGWGSRVIFFLFFFWFLAYQIC